MIAYGKTAFIGKDAYRTQLVHSMVWCGRNPDAELISSMLQQ